LLISHKRNSNLNSLKSIRLPPAELAVLRVIAERLGMSVSALLVKAVREILGSGPELLNDNASVLAESNNQAQAIGRNSPVR